MLFAPNRLTAGRRKQIGAVTRVKRLLVLLWSRVYVLAQDSPSYKVPAHAGKKSNFVLFKKSKKFSVWGLRPRGAFAPESVLAV